MQEQGNQSETPAQPQPSTFEPPSYSAPLTDFPSIPIPSPTGEMQSEPWRTTAMGNNDSGTGAAAVLPAELQGFSWAACLMNFFWSIGMQFWLGLLILPISIVAGLILRLIHIPVLGGIVNLGLMIGFGVKGNEWAWQNRRWDSLEQFKATQRVWTVWGIVLWGLWVLMIVFLFVVLGAAMMAMLSGGARVTPGTFPTR